MTATLRGDQAQSLTHVASVGDRVDEGLEEHDEAGDLVVEADLLVLEASDEPDDRVASSETVEKRKVEHGHATDATREGARNVRLGGSFVVKVSVDDEASDDVQHEEGGREEEAEASPVGREGPESDGTSPEVVDGVRSSKKSGFSGVEGRRRGLLADDES